MLQRIIGLFDFLKQPQQEKQTPEEPKQKEQESPKQATVPETPKHISDPWDEKAVYTSAPPDGYAHMLCVNLRKRLRDMK